MADNFFVGHEAEYKTLEEFIRGYVSQHIFEIFDHSSRHYNAALSPMEKEVEYQLHDMISASFGITMQKQSPASRQRILLDGPDPFSKPHFPNFLASLGNQAQMEAYHARNDMIPLRLLYLRHPLREIKNSRLDIEVPMIHGLDYEGRRIYFLALVEKLHIDLPPNIREMAENKSSGEVTPQQQAKITSTVNKFCSGLPEALDQLSDFLQHAATRYVTGLVLSELAPTPAIAGPEESAASAEPPPPAATEEPEPAALTHDASLGADGLSVAEPPAVPAGERADGWVEREEKKTKAPRTPGD